MPLHATLIRKLLSSPRRLAVVDDQGTHSAGKILAGAYHMAALIRRETRKPNVALMLPTGGVFPMALLGAWQAGKVAVPVNYLLEKRALQHVFTDSGVDTVLTVGKLLDFIGGPEMLPPGVKIIKLDEHKFKGLPPIAWPHKYAESDLAVLLYTSGTSGLPKGVMLTHGNLSSNAVGAIRHAGLDACDAFLGVLPNFHAFGLTVLTLVPLLVKAKAVYTARFVPRRLVELMVEHRPDVFIAVPSMYAALNEAKNAGRDAGASLKLVVSGAEPLPAAVAERFEQVFGARILEGYGLTETSPASHWCTPERQKPHSVGQPLPGVRCFIVDDQLNILGPDHDGEVLLAGPNLMAGYWNLPEQTAQAVIQLHVPGEAQPVRCLRTGDIGRQDAEGYLWITGRKKEMLICAGENVFPREIEEVLNRHPAVNASGVVGRKDPLRGEVPIAFVEFKEGRSATPDALRQHCAAELPPFKVPKEVRALDKLPRNPTGKILRRDLSEMLKKEG